MRIGKMTTVSVISRDEGFASGLMASLKFLGYQAWHAKTVEEGQQREAQSTVDCVLVDDSIAAIVNPSVLANLLVPAERPVFVLVDEPAEWQEIQLLTAGIADYLPKSVGMAALGARIKRSVAMARRGEARQELSPVLSVSMAAQTVSFGERILRLSHRELQLLEALVRAANAVLSREALLDRVWGLDSLEFEVRTVDVAIARLRRKLAEHMGVNPIETVPGAGYRYRTDTVRVEWVDSPSDTGGGGS